MARDQLIGYLIQVSADEVWLRTDSEKVVTDSLDQCGLPAGSDSAKGIPGMASNKAKPRRRYSELLLSISVSVWRRLMVPHAICAEATLEEIDDPRARADASAPRGDCR